MLICAHFPSPTVSSSMHELLWEKEVGARRGTSFERGFDMHSTAAVMAEHSILTVCLVGWCSLF